MLLLSILTKDTFPPSFYFFKKKKKKNQSTSLVSEIHKQALLCFQGIAYVFLFFLFWLNFLVIIHNNPRQLSYYSPPTTYTQITMYPRIKVRVEVEGEKSAVHQYDRNSVLSLKDVQFLSTQDSCFPVKENLDVSSPPVVKIPKSYVPSITLPTNSASEDKKSNFDEEDRPNIRASAIPRPRAVLSSPNNDEVIGNKNRIKALPPSALSNQKLFPSRHAQCKVTPRRTIDDGSMSTRKFKECCDGESDLKGKNRPATAISSQRRNSAS